MRETTVRVAEGPALVLAGYGGEPLRGLERDPVQKQPFKLRLDASTPRFTDQPVNNFFLACQHD